MRMTRLLPITAALALTVALTACGTSTKHGPATLPGTIDVNLASCGGHWHLAHPGWHTFQIRNTGGTGAEVDLSNPANGAVYRELEELGPNTTTPMTLNVGSGKYAFVCTFVDTNTTAGETVTVPGHAKGTPATLPITFNELIPVAKKYQAVTESALKVLATETHTLNAAVQAGKIAAAKRDWLTAHLQYQTLGAAYGAFGNYDNEIDGRADPVGVNSPKFTGFYRLEYGLWHGQSDAELKPVSATLNKDVNALVAWWPSQQISLITIGRRAHEVIENALEFQLTGHDDYGSGTTLASTAANVTASFVLLNLLHPLLAPRYNGLKSVYFWLNRLRSLLEQEHLRNGSWVPVSRLSTSARQEIDAACGQALQELAPIASLTEPRNTPSDF
jgi:iron uptake system component EfeO